MDGREIAAMVEQQGRTCTGLIMLASRGWLIGVIVFLSGPGAAGQEWAEVHRHLLAPGVYATLKPGRTAGIEASPPAGPGAQRFLQQYLAIEGEWAAYQGRLNVFVPLDRLKPGVRREVLLAVYPEDVVDEAGWRHRVVDSRETLEQLCEWMTGKASNSQAVLNDTRNQGIAGRLSPGQEVLFPKAVLDPVMARPTPERIARPARPADVPGGTGGELRYLGGRDAGYAVYRLKKGESLYTAVVVRFTDFRENADVLEACAIIAARNGIRDVRDIKAGTDIRIPLEMLSDRYLPSTHERRLEFEATLKEAERLRAAPAVSQDLSDVVVILDPGHGGKDPGARDVRAGLYEDEINYDIVCRIYRLLEGETGARVYVTLQDKSSGLRPTEAKRFVHDEDEHLTTTPPYPNDLDPNVSANLRWMMANAIYDREVKRGVDPRKIVFTSVHTDMLYNGSLRGAMIYIPGAAYRRGQEIRRDVVYARYEEGRSHNVFSSNPAELRRDEALSRNFAEVVLEQLGRRRIKRHDQGDPIRSQIRRSQNQVFVPAVLRNTKVPTKILIETANLNNATDRERLADPAWRQQFAEAYVDALRAYFAADSKVRTASTPR